MRNKTCDRCKNIIVGKSHYRYVFVWKEPSNTTFNADYSKMLVFCEKCQQIFDKLDDEMRLKYLYKDNKTLIKFYEQYGRGTK